MCVWVVLFDQYWDKQVIDQQWEKKNNLVNDSFKILVSNLWKLLKCKLVFSIQSHLIDSNSWAILLQMNYKIVKDDHYCHDFAHVDHNDKERNNSEWIISKNLDEIEVRWDNARETYWNNSLPREVYRISSIISIEKISNNQWLIVPLIDHWEKMTNEKIAEHSSA